MSDELAFANSVIDARDRQIVEISRSLAHSHDSLMSVLAQLNETRQTMAKRELLITRLFEVTRNMFEKVLFLLDEELSESEGDN